MSSADEGATGAYVREIEKLLARHGDGPFVFSPRDWALAAGWFERGVPLDLVRDALDDVEERRRGRQRIVSRGLGAVASAVEESFETLLEGRLELDPADRGRPAPPAAGEPLDSWVACAEERRDDSPLVALLLRLIEASRRGEAPESLDRELDARIVDVSPLELSREAAQAVEVRLASFRERMAPEVLEETRQAALVRHLRVRLGLRRLG